MDDEPLSGGYTPPLQGAAESRDSARASFSPADPLPDSPVRRFERATPPKRYRRKRDSSSPFFAGFRPPRQRQLSSSFSNRPSYRSPKRNSSHSSLLRTPEQLRQPLACVSTTEASIENIPRLSATGAKQFLFDTESPSSASGTHRTSPSDPFVSARVPKKVVRADDFWQKDRPKGPSVPEKSPLRDLLGPLDALRIRPLSPLTDPSDDEVRVKLRPSPLKLSKPALHSLSKRSFLGKTEGPEGAQAQLQPARKEVSPRTHDFLLKKAISKSSITESDKGELAEEVEALESDWIRRNRKLTLEALEGAATPTLEFSPEKLLSMMSRDRNSSLSEHVTKEPVPEVTRTDTEPTMDSLHPESAAAMTAHRREAIRLAKAQERAVAEKCKRSDQDPPGYTFDELIGKGSFGRVYKGFD